MKVKNINGTRFNTCNCGSWLDHWSKFSRQSLPPHCQEITCLKKPEVGAHVQKDSLSDRSWYIVPLCRDHHAQTGTSLEVMVVAVLVPANVAETCGRRL